MSEFTERDLTRLTAAFHGKLSPAESLEFDAWLAADPERAAAARRLRLAWDVAAQTSTEQWDGEAMWRAVMRHRGEVTDGATAGSPSVQRKPGIGFGRATEERANRRSVWSMREGLLSGGTPSGGMFPERTLRPKIGLANRILPHWLAAALFAVVAGLGVWLVQLDRAGSRVGAQAYQTAAGQRSTVRLSDGSMVILGPATTVATTAHGMTVTGEAYFAVTPRSARPFVVRTSNALVRVLGTRFSVRQYPGESRSSVVVEEGRVALSPERYSRPGSVPAIVAAGMLAFVVDSSVSVTREVDTREYTGWTHGTLVFAGVPLRLVVPELARAYGMDIRISDSALAQRVVRTEVSVSSDSLNAVLDMLCRVLDAHLLRDGQSFVLSPGREAAKSLPAAPSRRLSPQPEQQYGR